MLSVKDLIHRIRHNMGFGVQSPYAFHFVTSVLRERHAYYDYADINKSASGCGVNASHCRRLFRVANYSRPCNIVMSAPDGAAAYALASAVRSVPAYIYNMISSDDDVAAFMRERGCKISSGDVKPLFGTLDKLGLLYVGHSFSYADVVAEAIKYASHDTVIMVEGIHSSRDIKNWWQNIKQNPAVVVTFDLYSMGFLFFDKKYKKQHYTLLMR